MRQKNIQVRIRFQAPEILQYYNSTYLSKEADSMLYEGCGRGRGGVVIISIGCFERKVEK